MKDCLLTVWLTYRGIKSLSIDIFIIDIFIKYFLNTKQGILLGKMQRFSAAVYQGNNSVIIYQHNRITSVGI